MVTALYVPALLTAFVITLVEMTEVVALVFALRGEDGSVERGVYGAISGTAVVAVLAVGFSAAILMFPEDALLWASAVVLFGFGLFLFRSTLRSYRRARTTGSPAAPPGGTTRSLNDRHVQFFGGFTVGIVETVETVVVLIALTAAGYGFSAAVGALIGGAVLVGLALVLHGQVRRVKVPWLKWFGTALVFSYAVFWGGEAAGVAWPAGDLFLVVLVLAALILVRALIALDLGRSVPLQTKS